MLRRVAIVYRRGEHVITGPCVDERSAQKILYNSKSNQVYMILEESKSVHILHIRSFRSYTLGRGILDIGL